MTLTDSISVTLTDSISVALNDSISMTQTDSISVTQTDSISSEGAVSADSMLTTVASGGVKLKLCSLEPF